MQKSILELSPIQNIVNYCKKKKKCFADLFTYWNQK